MQQVTTSKSTKSTEPKTEGSMTKQLEQQTARLPSGLFLALAGLAVAGSLGLSITKRQKGWANFVGLWVPSLLLLGVYNKIVKTHGSDEQEQEQLLH